MRAKPDDWSLVHEGYRPEQEGLREALCTIGNGYFATRRAAEDLLRETGGEGGIRTLDTVSRIHAFQACAFSHSATSPLGNDPAI
jgi:hypothetical protein